MNRAHAFKMWRSHSCRPVRADFPSPVFLEHGLESPGNSLPPIQSTRFPSEFNAFPVLMNWRKRIRIFPAGFAPGTIKDNLKIEVSYLMKAVRFFSLIIALALSASCASHKNNNDDQLRRAYAAGAAAARMQMQQSQMQQPEIPPPGDPQVRILGAVKNPLLIWSDGLTLARALVLAEYQRNSAPSSITIYRNNQPLQIDPQAVLNGADYPLFPGDIVYLQD